ncbi:hypothetical protein F2Q69_00037998 [Brassica cretica]|uniref:A20-type domain-containing protein n=1 Tax=Brassica cretica TaxID=69181 RepID=A0A8S9SUC6_BRACR|nr:hypothetical protein F2Q69_00037998 [Brassica cretica]
MAEEHRCQTPEGHRLCSNNCGFLSATMNVCSKCYGNLCLKQQTCMKSTVKSFLSSSVVRDRFRHFSDDLTSHLKPISRIEIRPRTCRTR